MSKEMEIRIRPIFSTPLLVFTVPDHERINKELRRAILEREASHPAEADHEVVGWSSPHDMSMFEWAGPAIKDLMTPIIEVATPAPSGRACTTRMSETSPRTARAAETSCCLIRADAWPRCWPPTCATPYPSCTTPARASHSRPPPGNACCSPAGSRTPSACTTDPRRASAWPSTWTLSSKNSKTGASTLRPRSEWTREDMIKTIVLIVVLGVIAAMYAAPSFYLRKGVGHSTQYDVTQYLGSPFKASDNPEGSAVWTYQTEKIPKVCVEYVLTFNPKPLSENPSQPVLTNKKTLSKWDWRWC